MKWGAGSTRALRRHLGFTQREMGAHLGIRQQTISDWERGKFEPRGGSITLLEWVSREHSFTYHEPTPIQREDRDDEPE